MLSNLTIVIPFRNGQSSIARLLHSLPSGQRVIVVDDLSEVPFQIYPTDSTAMLDVKVIRLEQRGYFSGAVNAGIEACDTDVLVLNQDVWLEGERWQAMLLEQRAQHAMIGDGVFTHPFLPNGYVQGTFMFLRRDALGAVGLLNERDYPLWGSTAEWQLRAARRGYKALPIVMANYGMGHARGNAPYGSAIAAALQESPEQAKRFIRTPPLVSVVITCYNYGRYLSDAVNSLIGGPTCLGVVPPQTLQSFEIIIVDDGSKDDSPKIGAALADPNKGIRYLGQINKGSAAAANTGIQRALGKYVTVLDADDMMQPTRLEKMLRLAERNPHSVIYDDVYWVEQGPQGWQPTRIYTLAEYNFERMLQQNAMHKGIFYEHSAWQAAGGYPETMRDGREDWGFNIALGQKGYCGIRIPEPLYWYRRHELNRTRTNTTREMREYFMEQLQGLFPNLYAGERPMGCCGNKAVVKSNGNGNGASLSARGGRMAASEMVGATGMVLLEYLLTRAGPVPYIGAITHATYVFGGSRKTAYVDVRDVPAMLEIQEGRNTAFRQVQVQAAKTELNFPATPEIPIPETVSAFPQTEPLVLEAAGGAAGDMSVPPMPEPVQFPAMEVADVAAKPKAVKKSKAKKGTASA